MRVHVEETFLLARIRVVAVQTNFAHSKRKVRASRVCVCVM